MHNIYTLHCMLMYTVPNACHISAAILLMYCIYNQIMTITWLVLFIYIVIA